jgi:hypothetical protein
MEPQHESRHEYLSEMPVKGQQSQHGAIDQLCRAEAVAKSAELPNNIHLFCRVDSAFGTTSVVADGIPDR